MKILSISVAAYNAEKWIKKCLDSFICDEILDGLEVIVVDDGSKDGTSTIVQQYVSKYPHSFKLINKENGGHGSTINTSIQIAHGKYFKIVDSDDWVEKNGLIDLVRKLGEMDVDAVLSPYYTVYAENDKREHTEYAEGLNENYQNKILNINKMNVRWKLSMHSVTFRTKLLQDNFIPIDEKYFYVDQEYMVFYLNKVKTVFLSDIPVYDYLLGTIEQSMNFSNMIKRRDQHLTVCKTILTYYCNCNNNANVVKSLVENCIISEYRLLFSIPDCMSSKTELIEFENILKNMSKDIYGSVISNGIRQKKETAVIILVLRILHFRGYQWFHHVLTSRLFMSILV